MNLTAPIDSTLSPPAQAPCEGTQGILEREIVEASNMLQLDSMEVLFLLKVCPYFQHLKEAPAFTHDHMAAELRASRSTARRTRTSLESKNIIRVLPRRARSATEELGSYIDLSPLQDFLILVGIIPESRGKTCPVFSALRVIKPASNPPAKV